MIILILQLVLTHIAKMIHVKPNELYIMYYPGVGFFCVYNELFAVIAEIIICKHIANNLCMEKCIL